MLLIITIIGVALLILGAVFICLTQGDKGFGWVMFGMPFLIVGVAIGGVCLYDITEEPILDNKIAMYQEENALIEKKVEDTVRAYCEFEGKTLSDLKIDNGSFITIAAAYPELSSSELVKSQIELYNSNSNKIKELKAAKLSIPQKRWWLYFGSNEFVEEVE